MKYERDLEREINPQPHAIPRVPDKGVDWTIEVWLTITVSGTIVFGVVVAWVLWVMDAYPFVKAIFVGATALIPILGIVMCVLKLIEQWNKMFIHQTIDIGQFGTVFRTMRGKVQVVAPNETFVLESEDAIRKPVGGQRQISPSAQIYEDDAYRQFVERVERTLGKAIEEVPLHTLLNTDIGEEAEEETPPIYPYREIETETETEPSLDEAAMFLHAEEMAAKKNVDLVKRQQTKDRIKRLLACGMKHRTVAKQVGLSGGSYKRYQELCEEMGIDTNE